MHDLLVVEVLEPLQHLFRVVGDGPLVALQRTPLGLQQLLQRSPGNLKITSLIFYLRWVCNSICRRSRLQPINYTYYVQNDIKKTVGINWYKKLIHNPVTNGMSQIWTLFVQYKSWHFNFLLHECFFTKLKKLMLRLRKSIDDELLFLTTKAWEAWMTHDGCEKNVGYVLSRIYGLIRRTINLSECKLEEK